LIWNLAYEFCKKSITLKTSNIKSAEELYTFIESKKEPLNDETVYLSEEGSINLLFNKIKNESLLKLKKII